MFPFFVLLLLSFDANCIAVAAKINFSLSVTTFPLHIVPSFFFFFFFL